MNLTSLFLLIPGISFGICGFILKKYTTDINMWVGYRTPLARKNSDTWAAANAYCANLLIIGSGIFTSLGLISFAIPDMGVNGIFIVQGLVLGFVIILVVATERHLNKLFDKNGNRKV